MTRVLLTLVLAAGLTAAANATTVQFSVDGVPVDGSVPVEVRPSDWINVDVWIAPDAPISAWFADIFPTGDWPVNPLLDIQPVPVGDWADVENAFFENLGWDPGFGVYSIGGFVGIKNPDDPGGPWPQDWAGPGPVAMFEIHIPDAPVSTILNLEFDAQFVEPAADVVLPLVLHVTPEPATIGLLVLGGLAALRRRFA